MEILFSGFSEPGPGSMTLDAWLWTEYSDPATFDEDIIVYYCIVRILEWQSSF